MAVPAFAQTATATPTRSPATDPNCGNGLPCGPIPWPLPVLPYLPSPTIFPTIYITATVAPTSIGGVTPTAAVSPTFGIDGVQDAIATLEGMLNGTPIGIDGATFNPAGLGSDAGQFFGTLKGIQELHLGPFTPLIIFVFVAFLFVMGVQSGNILLPILMALFGFIRRIVSTILDFIPL